MSPIVPTIILALLIVSIAFLIKSQAPIATVAATAAAPEPFTDKNAIPNIAFCPFNSTATILQSGETHCCVGKSSKKFGCLEKTVCTLSSSPDGKIPTCGVVMKKHYDEQAKKHCYPGMPNYYEKTDQYGNVTERGCYSGPSNISMTGPYKPAQQPTCFVDYSNQARVKADPKSCYNTKRLAEVACPKGINCQKSLVQTGKGNPMLLQVSWMGKRQMFGRQIDAPVTTYTLSSIVDYWNVVFPEWSKAIPLATTRADALGEFIYEIRKGILEGKVAPQDTTAFARYYEAPKRL
jgi:hypothetical protein